MSITTLNTPEPTGAQAPHSGQAGIHPVSLLRRGEPCPLPGPEKMRGLRLVAVWVALTAASWAVLGGAGYGLYALVQSFML
ncbi:hypothetical protein [Azospirillum sp. TSO35-2]|uniref:hypothetical protein n=1 Tax=Azospirillum sp. TSO35-2 TaxID=716796 RepID=UPI002000108A|nr:hypothetical protein [Azospirillum sp. TSO35-2]